MIAFWILVFVVLLLMMALPLPHGMTYSCHAVVGVDQSDDQPSLRRGVSISGMRTGHCAFL